MSDIHIDDFYKDVAKILNLLYSFFPRPAQIYVEDISGPDDPDEFGLHSQRHQACFSTMIWLAESGYMRYIETIRQEALDQAVLTQKAFTLLTSVSDLAEKHPFANDPDKPESVKAEYSTNIHLIRHALRTRSSIQIREIVSYLLEQARQH
jgi:hypothetical protein